MEEENIQENTEDFKFEPIDSEGEELGTKDKLKDLREKIKFLQAEKQEYLTGWQKERAEFANFKKDETKRKEEIFRIAREKAVEDFLPVLDSFEMAFTNKESWEKVDKNWRAGVEYIYQQLTSAFSENGVSIFGSIGDKFDPYFHQSIESILSQKEEQDHTVAEVVQKGYKMGDTVLRPAKVKIFEYKE